MSGKYNQIISSEDPPVLKKKRHIGCMAGILQLLDRHQIHFYGHKRISAGNLLFYEFISRHDSNFADLVRLPVGTRLYTLLYGQSLVVTDAKPFSVNGYNFYFLKF